MKPNILWQRANKPELLHICLHGEQQTLIEHRRLLSFLRYQDLEYHWKNCVFMQVLIIFSQFSTKCRGLDAMVNSSRVSKCALVTVADQELWPRAGKLVISLSWRGFLSYILWLFCGTPWHHVLMSVWRSLEWRDSIETEWKWKPGWYLLAFSYKFLNWKKHND